MNKQQNAQRNSKQSPAELFQLKAKAQSNHFPSLNLKNVTSFFEGKSEDEMTINRAFKEDIEIFKAFYKEMYKYIMKTQSEDSAKQNNSIVKLNEKEVKVVTQAETILTLDAGFTDSFYKLLYDQLISQHGEKITKIAPDYKKLKEQINLLGKEYKDGSDKVLTYLEDQKMDRFVFALKELFNTDKENDKFYNKDNKIPEVVNAKSRATIFEATLNSTEVFPLSEEKLKKYQGDLTYSVYLELNEEIKKEKGNYFNEIEIDYGTSDDKIGVIEAQLEVVRKVNKMKLPFEEGYKFNYRVRKLGNHTVDSMPINGKYRMGNKEVNRFSEVVVTVEDGGLGSIMHEIAHLIDLEVLKGTKIRNLLVEKLRNKMDSEGMTRSYRNYLKIPTEIVARYIELGCFLSGNTKHTDLASIVDTEEDYKNNKAYFGFANWTEEQKQECLKFYEFFCEHDDENKITQEERENFVKGMENSSIDYERRNNVEVSKWTEEQKRTRNYKAVAGLYTVEDVEHILKTALEEGDKAEFTVQQIILILQGTLSRNHLIPYNADSNLEYSGSREGQANLAMVDGVMKLLLQYFKKISASEQAEILTLFKDFGDINRWNYWRLFNVKKKYPYMHQAVLKELAQEEINRDQNIKTVYGYWNALDVESFIEIINEEQTTALNTLLELMHTQDSANSNRRKKNQRLEEINSAESPIQIDTDIDSYRNYVWSQNLNVDVESIKQTGEKISLNALINDKFLTLPEIFTSKEALITMASKSENETVLKVFENIIYSMDPKEVKSLIGDKLTSEQKTIIEEKIDFKDKWSEFAENKERIAREKREAQDIEAETVYLTRVIQRSLTDVDFTTKESKEIIKNAMAKYQIEPDKVEEEVEMMQKFVSVTMDKLNLLEKVSRATGGYTFMIASEEDNDTPINVSDSKDALERVREEFNPALAVLEQINYFTLDDELSEEQREEMKSAEKAFLESAGIYVSPIKNADSLTSEELIELEEKRDERVKHVTRNWGMADGVNDFFKKGNIEGITGVYKKYLKEKVVAIFAGKLGYKMAKQKVKSKANSQSR